MRFAPFFFTILTLAHAALAAERPPNIVLIFTDDQGYADAGCFGGKGFATPNLDRMAREGIRFTDFHVAQAVCSASRAALLTGCYPNRVGIGGALSPKARIGLNPEETTIAEVLEARGYATGMVGKWHLGDAPGFRPMRQGFDEWLGIPYSHDMWPNHPEARAGTYPALPLHDGDQIVKADLGWEDLAQLTTRYTERAVDFIARHKERPFFLYLAHNLPHVPLAVSEKFKGKSERGLYGDVLMEIDWSVGQVLASLQQHGLDENTLVVFTTDNGPWLSYGEHGGSAGPFREGKGTVWEGGTRVPFLARWPGRIRAGAECREMAMTIDLLPTFTKLAGAALPARKIDGLDIWPLLAGTPDAKSPHSALFFYYGQNELRSVRSGPWKLIFAHNYPTLAGRTGGKDGKPVKYQQARAGLELYDLGADPAETTNVAEKYPDQVKRLQALAETMRADLGDSLTQRKPTGAREPGRVEAAASASLEPPSRGIIKAPAQP